MRQSISYLAAIAAIAVSYRGAMSPATILDLQRALTLAPIDTFVDWLEAAYGGPIESNSSPEA
jgi:hypothetical protein